MFLSDWQGVHYWMSKMEDIANSKSDWDDPEYDSQWMPIALRVDLAELGDLLQDDELGARDSTGDAWFIEDDIPPALIEVWDGSRWVPVKSADEEGMAEEAIEKAEYESDDGSPYEPYGDNDGWWEYDLEQFMPSRRASVRKVARRWLHGRP